MRYYPLHVIATTYSLVAKEMNHHLTSEPAEGQLTHLNDYSRYHGDNSGNIILAKLHKL